MVMTVAVAYDRHCEKVELDSVEFLCAVVELLSVLNAGLTRLRPVAKRAVQKWEAREKTR